jgi:hypothetical protein
VLVTITVKTKPHMPSDVSDVHELRAAVGLENHEST